jgi:hypothetical protein
MRNVEVRRTKHQFCVQYLFFLPENRAVCENVGKFSAEQATLLYGASLNIAATHIIFNTYWFYTATAVTRTRLNVTSHYVASFVVCASFRLPTQNRHHDVRSGEREGHKGFNYSVSQIVRKATNYWLCVRLHRVAWRTNFSARWCQNLSSVHFGIYCDLKDDIAIVVVALAAHDTPLRHLAARRSLVQDCLLTSSGYKEHLRDRVSKTIPHL